MKGCCSHVSEKRSRSSCFQRGVPEAAFRLFAVGACEQFQTAAVAEIKQRDAFVAFAPCGAQTEAERFRIKTEALVKVADAECQMVEPAAGNAFVRFRICAYDTIFERKKQAESNTGAFPPQGRGYACGIQGDS